jgi:hypothetical protein
MNYALLQKSLDVPPVDKLRNAFRVTRKLTDADAHILARDAYGILVKNLNIEDATGLQLALQGQGIETEVVAENLLPQLPPPKLVRKIECRPEALILHDPLGRPFPLEWQHIMMIAAGAVRLQDFVRTENIRTVMRFSARGDVYPATEVDYETREESRFHHLVEIIVSRAVLRYSIDCMQIVLAQALGTRFQHDLNESFMLFVQDLTCYAPHIAVNRGAYHLRAGDSKPMPYPTKNAFYEEIVWLLFQLQRQGGQ